MNAGSDYARAKGQAQANADWSKQPWVLFAYQGVWWVERLAGFGPETQAKILAGDSLMEVIHPASSSRQPSNLVTE